MVIDTSAIVAILEQEPEGERFARLVADAVHVRISAVTLVEAGMVMHGRRSSSWADVRLLVEDGGIEVVPVDHAQALLALDAFARYAKGQHPAKLNLGDLFSYALAKQLGEPLLFKGGDFAVTDIPRAL